MITEKQQLNMEYLEADDTCYSDTEIGYQF